MNDNLFIQYTIHYFMINIIHLNYPLFEWISFLYIDLFIIMELDLFDIIHNFSHFISCMEFFVSR
jgi:hypothetical protein